MSRHAAAARSPMAPGAAAALLATLICAALRTSAIAAAAATGTTAAPPASAVDVAGSASSAEDIRDIRGPQFVAPAWLLPALVAGGTVLALGAYGIWRRQRRHPPRTPLPFEVALQRLEGIRALMQPQSVREFSTAVSDIVRSYIEQRFDLTVTHRTTEEFLRDLLEFPHAELARHRGLLSEFLHQCDLVKFAGMSLNLQSMESLHHSACDFVRTTGRPDETAQIGTAGPSRDDRKAHDSIPST